jgi:hypothetical protein
MSCRISTRTYRPWSAPRNTYGRGGTTRGTPRACFSLIRPPQRARTEGRNEMFERSLRRRNRHGRNELRPIPRRRAATAGRRSLPAAEPARVLQSGRERPPSAARQVVPAAAPRVAHAPAAGARVKDHVTRHAPRRVHAHERDVARDMSLLGRPMRAARSTRQVKRNFSSRGVIPCQ